MERDADLEREKPVPEQPAQELARPASLPAQPPPAAAAGRILPEDSRYKSYIVGSIAIILVACLLVAIGSADGASDVYAYIGLCLGPLGLIGLLVAIGLTILNRAGR